MTIHIFSGSKSDHEALKKIIILTIPAVVEYTLQTCVTYADYIMVGKLGVEASATIGLTSEITWLFKAGTNALGVGVMAYISMQYGAKRKDKIKNAVTQAYLLAIVIGIITTLLALLISPYFPIWLGADESLQKSASLYFAITSLPGIFFAFNVIGGNVRKSVTDMKTPLIVNGIMNILNVVLNYFLIFDAKKINIYGIEFHIYRLGLGVTGAAIATALSVVIGGILMVYANEIKPESSIRKNTLNIDTEVLKNYVIVGVPAFISSIIISGGRVIFTGMLARLGTVTYAAHAIAFEAESLFFVPLVGITGPVAALSGNVKGEGNLEKLNNQTKLICKAVFGLMTISALLLFVFSELIMSLMTDDAEVIHIGGRLLKIVALNEPLFGISMIMQSVFNGIGNTKPPLYVSAFTQWVFRVGGTFLTVSILGLGIEAAWLCMITDNIMRAVLLSYCYIRQNSQLIISMELKNT